MSMSYPVADLITRIRNGQQARLAAVDSPASKLRAALCDVLQREGYIRGYSQSEQQGRKTIRIELKYHEGEPVIRKIDCVSTPGRRVYTKISALPRQYNGLGIAILSTPKGVMSDNEARAANVGGEVICAVF